MTKMINITSSPR